MNEKIVLAYSGGLDTTVIIPWLKENYENCEIIAVCVDVGQGKETDGLEERAKKSGAAECIILDVRKEFVTDYIYPMLKANAVYEDKYLLGTSIARPLIAKALVEIALSKNATAICHGATGKGNDQIRFELTVKALAPQLKIIAPWRTWDIQSREEEIEYLKERGIEVPMTKEDSYSRDRNMWHLSHEGLELEDPKNEPNFKKLLQLSVTPEEAPDEPTYVELTFEKGIPIKLNGKAVEPVELIEYLNEVGGKNGIGITDLVENRVVGMKSRGVYETPGGTILYHAHRDLEYLCLDKQTTAFKEIVATKFAELTYSGEWFTPLREALSKFVDATQETVTGTVKLKLYKGNIISAGSESEYSLYNENLASFTTGELYDHHDAEGFINLFGLPLKVRALMMMDKGKQAEKIKQNPKDYENVLSGKKLYMLFQKTSTRTALSFAMGMTELGGVYFSQNWCDSNFAIGEIKDEIRYVGKNVDIVAARLKTNCDIEEMAKYSTVPVINGCCNKFHPCQAMADMLTIHELFGKYQIKMLYIGARNNVFNSLMQTLPHLGGQLYGLTPITQDGAYDSAIDTDAQNTKNYFTVNEKISKQELYDLAAEMDVIYTDTWVDMEFFNDKTFEEKNKEKIEKMEAFRVDRALLKKSRAIVLHDMPIHAGYEIERDVAEDNMAYILQQAENRRHAQKGIIHYLIGISVTTLGTVIVLVDDYSIKPHAMRGRAEVAEAMAMIKKSSSDKMIKVSQAKSNQRRMS
ncbi:argininosuccinate synthase [Holotrichia oblita]|nr:argininosuccinate synthase [Holotrichia oblita]